MIRRRTAALTIGLSLWLGACAPPAPGPRLEVLAATGVDFGQVGWFAAASAPSTQALTLVNSGSEPLNLHSIELLAAEAGTAAQDLRWEPVDAVLPVALAPRAGANLLRVELTLNPSSTGLQRWLLRVRSDDPDRPVLDVPVEAQVVAPPDCEFSVNPAALRTSVAAPNDRDVAITFTNLGAAPVQRCLISNIRLSEETPAAIALAPGQPLVRVVEAGSSAELLLRLSPPSPSGEAMGALRFEVSRRRNPTVEVPLSISLDRGACLVIAPSEVDFGTVSMGCESPLRTFALYNACASPIVIDGIRLAAAAGQPAGGANCPGPSACPEFQLVSAPGVPEGGLTFGPGSAPLLVQAKYEPIDLGPDSGAIAVDAAEDGSPRTQVISLRGAGESRSLTRDAFRQGTWPRLDLLVVVDDSSAMAAHQASTSANLVALARYLEATPLRFQLAVASANGTAPAALLSGSGHPDKVLTRDSPDLEAQLQARLAAVGTSGTGGAHCLEQAVEALTEPLLSGANAGFLRSDAALSVLCITAGTDVSPAPVADYLGHLWSVKGLTRTSLFTFSAVGGLGPACPGDTGRLADAVALTRGTAMEICDPDWHRDLQTFGWLGDYPRSTFYLTSTPDLAYGPIEVAVGGQPLPPSDATGRTLWSYDAFNNAIVFEPEHVPEEGALIDVSYRTSCYGP